MLNYAGTPPLAWAQIRPSRAAPGRSTHSRKPPADWRTFSRQSAESRRERSLRSDTCSLNAPLSRCKASYYVLSLPIFVG